MDEMKIETSFMKKIMARLIKKAIRKKLGYDIDIHLNELFATVIDGIAHIHFNIDAELDKTEFTKIMEDVGL